MHDALAPTGQEAPSRSAPGVASGALDLAIVILNYNTEALLRECLRSVFASRGDLSYEVCVVDNASPDASAEMVRREFPRAHLIANSRNVGFSAGNNAALRWLGFADLGLRAREAGGAGRSASGALPRFVVLLNPDTLLPPDALVRMVAFLDGRPNAGVAGPRVRRPDGSLDRACRRSFPTPTVSLYRMMGLSRLFPRSRRFNAYNLEYLPEDAIHRADAVVGAFMMVRREAIQTVGLLDEAYFMYGEDLDWAKRIKDAGWDVWYNGEVEITHVKEAASQSSVKSRIDFYEAMWIFYRKHYQSETGWLVDKLIRLGIAGKGGLDIGRHLWRFCSRRAALPVEPRAGEGASPRATLANDAPEA